MNTTQYLDLPSWIDLHAPSILIGQSALFFYQIGERPDKVNCVITEKDFDQIAVLRPDCVGKQGSDQVIWIEDMIFFRTIQLFCYNAIKANLLSEENYAVISLDRLFLITSLDFTNPKREKEMEKILERMNSRSEPAAKPRRAR